MNFNRTEGVIELLNNLRNELLYTDKLSNDKDVFMAFRNQEIDFYYRGSKLFGYTKNGFISHKKFCFNANTNNEYIVLDKINAVTPIDDILQNYTLIKENAKNYAGIEGLGVSDLYQYDFSTENNYFLLDTEIAFYDDESKDRIDLLLYNVNDKELKFIEAKHFSNSELWAQQSSKPKVVNQINRYKERLQKEYHQILDEYKKYVSIINDHFNFNLPIPESICKDVSLFMFGFDNNQKEKIKRLLKEDGSLEGINYYFRGNSSQTSLETLYKSIKN